MKVKELISHLSGIDGEAIVVMASDPEGNSFHPLDAAQRDTYFENSGWDGEVKHPDDLYDGPCPCRAKGEDDCDECYEKRDRRDGVECVVLWP